MTGRIFETFSLQCDVHYVNDESGTTAGSALGTGITNLSA